jgi:hypothetical protein
MQPKITQKWSKSTTRHKISEKSPKQAKNHSKKIFGKKKPHGTMQPKKTLISGPKIPKKRKIKD